MFIQNFYRLGSSLRCGPSEAVGEYKPITDLGYMTAEERINAIMSAGQILREARANQHTYQDQSPDEQYKDNTDNPSIVYMDRMEAKEAVDKLSESGNQKIESALNQLNKEKESSNPDNSAFVESDPEQALKTVNPLN